jgi:hypothetical protein
MKMLLTRFIAQDYPKQASEYLLEIDDDPEYINGIEDGLRNLGPIGARNAFLGNARWTPSHGRFVSDMGLDDTLLDIEWFLE